MDSQFQTPPKSEQPKNIPVPLKLDKTYLDCVCEGINCVMRFAYFKDEADCVYVEVLPVRLGLFRRVVWAVKYVFGINDQLSLGTVMEAPTVIKLRDACEEFLVYNKSFVP